MTTAGVAEPVADVDASGAADVDDAPFAPEDDAAGSTSIADAPSEVAAVGAVPSADTAAAAGGEGTTGAGGGGGAFDSSSALICFLTSSASLSDRSGIPSLSGPCDSLNAEGDGLEPGPAGWPGIWDARRPVSVKRARDEIGLVDSATGEDTGQVETSAYETRRGTQDRL